MKVLVTLFFYVFVSVKCASVSSNGFELSVIHFNDFHARFEPINKRAAPCHKKQATCIGGFSRLYSAITKLKNNKPDSIVLNAGDNFQGSLWYNYYKWKAIVHFLNKLPIDVHTIGNHEFDDEIKGVVPLLRNLNAPVVVSNIDDSQEPSFQNLVKKSVIVTRSGRKIGVIGAIVTDTPESARPGKLKFLNEIDSVNKEARRLVEEDDVDTIVVLSHCGYLDELAIAKNAAPRIGLIVGGHSHSLLYNGVPPDNLTVHGQYPTVVRHKDGRNVLVVQASAFTRFVGDISVRYDNNGDVVSWTGAPLYLNESVQGDLEISNELKNWQKEVDEYGNAELGVSLVTLDKTDCNNYECNIGDFIADAMAFGYSNVSSKNARPLPRIALINSGALRNSIDIGKVTVGNLLETMPYYNTLDVGELQGKYIKEALEHAVVVNYGSTNLLQVSGLNVVYNMAQPEGSRVQEVKARCAECHDDTYEDLKMEKFYTVAMITFLVQGGDGFTSLSANLVNHTVGKDVNEYIQNYIIYKSPINQTIDGRIKFVD